MIVVSDTTPIHYLILIGEIELLPRLLGSIVIPTVVFHELQHENTPDEIRDYLASIPSWLSVRASSGIIDLSLSEIDPGEREAILLAEELAADGILIDDLAGRRIAVERGLKVLGTLGLLERAHSVGLIDLLVSFDDLKQAGFYVSLSLETKLRRKYGEI